MSVLQFHVAGLEELVPEERLYDEEVDVAVAQEVYRGIRHLHIQLVDTVHDEHVVLGELQATGLNESESHELQAYDVVALHAEVAGERHLLVAHLYGELHLRRDEPCMLCIVGHLLQQLALVQRVGGSGCPPGLLLLLAGLLRLAGHSGRIVGRQRPALDIFLQSFGGAGMAPQPS